MSADEFRHWVALMHQLGHNKGDCARLLGRSTTWVTHALRHGTDLTVALACAALLAGLPPFTSVLATSSRPRSGDQARP